MDALRLHRPAVRTQAGSGFTLIELLVVIAIISLLVSILVPSLTKAKEITKMTTCGVKMRSMGLAMNMYMNDSADLFPPYAYNPTPDMHLYWGDLMKPYVEDTNPYSTYDDSPCGEAFFCPSMGPMMGPGMEDWRQIPEGRTGSTKYMGFAYNNWVLGGHWGKESCHVESEDTQLKKITDIHAPSRVLCLSEAAEVALGWLPGAPTLSTNQVYAGTLNHFRHLSGDPQEFPGSGSCNVFYIDGHVSPATTNDLKTGWDNFYFKYPYMDEP